MKRMDPMRTDKKTALTLAVIAGLCLAQAANASALLSYEETASGTTGQGAVTTYSTLPASDFFGNSPAAATARVGPDAGF